MILASWTEGVTSLLKKNGFGGDFRSHLPHTCLGEEMTSCFFSKFIWGMGPHENDVFEFS